MMIFSPDKIQAICDEAISLGLQNDRSSMLYGLRNDYVASLDQCSKPGQQLLADLQAMNSVQTVLGSVPLERWLRNAAYAAKLRPKKKELFNDLADEVAEAVLPPPMCSLHRTIRNSFGIVDLRKILTENLETDTTTLSLVKKTDETVLTLLYEFSERGKKATRDFLIALRDSQPDNLQLSAEIENGLDVLSRLPDALISGQAPIPPLPECEGCWWREAAMSRNASVIATTFRSRISDVIQGRGIPNLTEGVPARLTVETPNFSFGARIVSTANDILNEAVGSPNECLIAADFESRHSDNAWSRVLVDADARGAVTLTALFLALFLQGGPLSAIADLNLRRLVRTLETPNGRD